jgi:hypothetical protein
VAPAAQSRNPPIIIKIFRVFIISTDGAFKRREPPMINDRARLPSDKCRQRRTCRARSLETLRSIARARTPESLSKTEARSGRSTSRSSMPLLTQSLRRLDVVACSSVLS